MHDDHDHTESHDGSGNPWPDRVNEAYYDSMGKDFGQRTRDRINWMCAQAKGLTALDVGCSQGIASILMAREGMRVVGLDIMRPTLAYALAEREKEIESVRERLEFRCSDLAAIVDEFFDTVIMGEVVEHQTNPVKFIRQAAKLVGDGGRLVITVPFGLHPWPDHKSTIFPGDIATAIAGEFAIFSMDVSDGYIRVVADRGEGDLDEVHQRVVKATESGAVQSQVRYYAVSSHEQALLKEVAQAQSRLDSLRQEQEQLRERSRALEAEIALRAQGLASLEAAIGDQDISDLQVTIERAVAKDSFQGRTEKLIRQAVMAKVAVKSAAGEIVAERARCEGLLQEELEHKAVAESNRNQITVLRADLGEKVAELARANAELAELRQRYEALQHSEQQLRVQSAGAEQELSAELARERSEMTKLQRANQSLKQAEQQLRSRLHATDHELAVAQHKRSGHFAHLVAERQRIDKLVALSQQLHEENQRYRNSIALAIGQAVIGLRSLRGVVGFPNALIRAIRNFRRRERGDMPHEPLVLPKVIPVVIPPVRQVAGVEANTIAGQPTAPAGSHLTGSDADRRALSIIGWKQKAIADRIPVMCVFDDFSRACFAPQAALIEPRPDNWEGLLEACEPRFLFVESSWKGNYGTWQYRVANYAHPPGQELAEMVSGFKARGIPTVFWNKEDPVHFDNFIAAAARFDHVLTTASEAIPLYQDRTQARVGVLQFAAEEALHNPIGSATRNEKVCFAGSFYANRFAERRDDQIMLLDAACNFNFDIYDRNFDANSASPSEFGFPERFQRFVQGNLSYEAVSRAYREYRVFLNVNSVIDSPTMFSRRVFELLACGTPVVSTWARGTEETFGKDLVWHVRNQEEAEEALNVLMTDDREWRRRSLAGIRAVMSGHTFRHRFAQVLDILGIDSPHSQSGHVVVVAEVSDQDQADAVTDSFARQEMVEGATKALLLVPRGFDVGGVSAAGVEVAAGAERDLDALLARSRQQGVHRMVAVMSPDAVYGKHYLTDSLIAAQYSRAGIIGKPADGLLSSQYARATALDAASLVFDEQWLLDNGVRISGVCGANAPPVFKDVRTYASDTANFMRLPGSSERGRKDEILKQIEA